MQSTRLVAALAMFSSVVLAQSEPQVQEFSEGSAAAEFSSNETLSRPVEGQTEGAETPEHGFRPKPNVSVPQADSASASSSPALGRALSEQERRVLIHQEVQTILHKMSRAMRELDYQGLVTFEFDNHVDSLKIYHKVIDGVEHERLVQLNGIRREVVSTGRAANCTAIGEHLLRGASMRLGERILRLGDLYQYSILGRQRIADREALLLGIKPRDEHRYGYVIALDRETALPLMMELVGGANKVRERFQFVDLQLGDLVSAEQLLPSDARAERVDQAHLCSSKEQLPDVHNTLQTWEAGWLPEGFVFTGQQQSRTGADQIMYTDGLNALSIFIQPVSTDEVLISGTTHRGATSVVMSKMSHGQQLYTVTAVGEIPGGSLRQIAESVRLRRASR
ncbi:MucB/RseB C-terminal domain-containing protein [Pseudoteredinibacter isoporae]|uniref:MucB/RseB C-terminal domain-containing protein n=1 Tax=Pseudoteredinibacter isoporae TaxID=570281 RepID=UPI00310C5176